MSFSSDEVNFLVYRYLQVRVKYVLFTFVTLYCVCIGNVPIDRHLALERILIVSAHFSVREYFLAYYL